MKLFLNQDFVNKEQFWPESAIPDGRPDSEVGNRTSYSPVELGLGLSLATIDISTLFCMASDPTYFVWGYKFNPPPWSLAVRGLKVGGKHTIIKCQ